MVVEGASRKGFCSISLPLLYEVPRQCELNVCTVWEYFENALIHRNEFIARTLPHQFVDHGFVFGDRLINEFFFLEEFGDFDAARGVARVKICHLAEQLKGLNLFAFSAVSVGRSLQCAHGF